MALHNKDLQKLQAMMMISMKVTQGMNNREIAKELNIHPETVDRRLIFAQKAGMFLDLERQIMQNLVPKAMKAIETAMEDGDAETALEVLKSVGVLKDPKAPKTNLERSDENELFIAIEKAREEQNLLEGTVDGTVVNGRRSLAGLLETGENTELRIESGTNQPVVELANATDEKTMGETRDASEQGVEGVGRVQESQAQGTKARRKRNSQGTSKNLEQGI